MDIRIYTKDLSKALTTLKRYTFKSTQAASLWVQLDVHTDN
jgi:hypothetical protein